MTTRLAALFVGAALLTSAAGCAGDGPARVSGAVTVDGKPLPEGEIVFEAVDGSKTPAAGPIKDGKYEVSVLPGAKRVRVNASRPARKPDPVMGAAAREAAVAPEFNERTTLSADIKPGGQTGLDFAVKAAP
jgi:hypothetical protein